MRLLLDEKFPVDFALHITGHEVATDAGLGWAGTKNGELLRRASTVCEVFVTLDRSLPSQQNITDLTIGVVVLRSRSNRLVDLVCQVDSLLAAIQRATRGHVEFAGQP